MPTKVTLQNDEDMRAADGASHFTPGPTGIRCCGETKKEGTMLRVGEKETKKYLRQRGQPLALHSCRIKDPYLLRVYIYICGRTCEEL